MISVMHGWQECVQLLRAAVESVTIEGWLNWYLGESLIRALVYTGRLGHMPTCLFHTADVRAQPAGPACARC